MCKWKCCGSVSNLFNKLLNFIGYVVTAKCLLQFKIGVYLSSLIILSLLMRRSLLKRFFHLMSLDGLLILMINIASGYFILYKTQICTIKILKKLVMVEVPLLTKF